MQLANCPSCDTENVELRQESVLSKIRHHYRCFKCNTRFFVDNDTESTFHPKVSEMLWQS